MFLAAKMKFPKTSSSQFPKNVLPVVLLLLLHLSGVSSSDGNEAMSGLRVEMASEGSQPEPQVFAELCLKGSRFRSFWVVLLWSLVFKSKYDPLCDKNSWHGLPETLVSVDYQVKFINLNSSQKSLVLWLNSLWFRCQINLQLPMNKLLWGSFTIRV